MKSLREIEAIIYKTDCKQFMRDGWSWSEPIPTKDENGNLIDNYFIYAADLPRKTFSTPAVIFGIYSDEEKTAYSTIIPKSEVKSIKVEDYTPDRAAERKAYDRYEELYPAVRECAYADCNGEQKKAVQEYLSCLEVFSGPVLWKFYHELFPGFFEWTKSVI